MREEKKIPRRRFLAATGIGSVLAFLGSVRSLIRRDSRSRDAMEKEPVSSMRARHYVSGDHLAG